MKGVLKLNEIRLGNKILHEGKIYTVDAKMMYAFFSGKIDYDIDNFEPVLLTEEWLLKLGFEKTKENFCTYDLGKISIYMPGIYYEEGRTYFNSWVIIEKSPKFVHQLQNLYFALTGQELEVKVDALQ